MMQAYVESLVKDAYTKWSSLEELDGIPPSSSSTLGNIINYPMIFLSLISLLNLMKFHSSVNKD